MANYKMITYTIDTDDGIYWVAEYPSLPGVIGTDKDVVNAVSDLIDNAEIHLQFLREIDGTIPKEDSFSNDKYSGRLTIRTTKKTHARIAFAAEQDGVSINQWVNEAINYELGCEDVRRNELMPLITDISTALVDLSKKSGEVFLESIKHYRAKETNVHSGYLEVKKNPQENSEITNWGKH